MADNKKRVYRFGGKSAEGAKSRRCYRKGKGTPTEQAYTAYCNNKKMGSSHRSGKLSENYIL